MPKKAMKALRRKAPHIGVKPKDAHKHKALLRRLSIRYFTTTSPE